MEPLNAPAIEGDLLELVRMAVREDMGAARVDRTATVAIAPETMAAGTIVARKAGTIAGTFLLGPILREYGARLKAEILLHDGGRVEANQAVARVSGEARAILSAERTLLNFLGHLSGIATLTARYVDAIADLCPPPVIVDTRKTKPGYRVLDKYAVRCGGGVNHRMGLFDGVMLKDNHLAALRASGETLAAVTARIRAGMEPGILLWLEVDTIEQLTQELAGGGADIVLLDNFTPHELRVAVELRKLKTQNSKLKTEDSKLETRNSKLRPLLEASGGVTLENVREVARTGVDRIAIGALTHSAPALDVSMEFS